MNLSDIIIYPAIFFFLYSTMVLLLTLLENKNRVYKPKFKSGNYPNVCVIVPCFNEEKTISMTVNSLLRLNYPKNKLEILIIDDGSTDQTLQKAKLLAQKHRSVQAFHKTNGGKHTALNYALTKTKAEFVGCLDADSFVTPTALSLIMPHFSDPEIVAVTPSIKVHQPRNILERVQKVEYLFGIFNRYNYSILNSLTVTPGPFTIFRRHILEKLGGFRHGHNTEDLEIALRMQSHHYRIANAPNASVYTSSPTSFQKLHHQRKRWYYGLIKNAWDYRFLILNKKYGDLGLFVFPMIFLSLATLLISSSYLAFQLSRHVVREFLLWRAVDFNISQIVFRIDWFFINTQSYAILSILLLGIIFTTILLGKRLSFEKSSTIKDFLFFIMFYHPLYFFWWASTLLAVASQKKSRW